VGGAHRNLRLHGAIPPPLKFARGPQTKVFKGKLPFAATKRTATHGAGYFAVFYRRCLDPDDLVKSFAVRALERG
jgi:hypothetical protein